MRIGVLLLTLLVSLSQADEGVLTAEWAERYLKQQQPHLLEDSEHDHVISLYYFGRYQHRHLMGLERVRGEDFLQYYTLLVFEEHSLLGYYQNLMSFPSSLNESGQVMFPVGIESTQNNSAFHLNINELAEDFKGFCLQQRGIEECYPWHSVIEN